MAIITYEHEERVGYKDTDQMGIMHHSNYIVLYENAEIERRGIMSPIIEVHSKYLWPALYDEVLTIKVMMDEMPSARLVIRSEVYNEAGRLINQGSVTLGFMHASTRRPCRAPEWFVAKLEEYMAGKSKEM